MGAYFADTGILGSGWARVAGLVGPKSGCNLDIRWVLRAQPISYNMLRDSTSGPEIGLPGRNSTGFELGSFKIGPSAGLRPAEGPILKLSRSESRPGGPFSVPEALLRNIE